MSEDIRNIVNPEGQKQIPLRNQLAALALLALNNIEDFRNLKIYPPKMLAFTVQLDKIPDLPLHIEDISQKTELTQIISKRQPLMNDLIQSLVPSSETITRSGERNLPEYPKDTIDQISNQPNFKRDVRIIDFLLDSDIARLWIQFSDDDFNKFLSLAEERNLPDCLVSQEEMLRVWHAYDEQSAYEWHRMTDLYRSSHPTENIQGSTPSKEQKQQEPEEPARYRFLDLYQKHNNLATALQELSIQYPNERI